MEIHKWEKYQSECLIKFATHIYTPPDPVSKRRSHSITTSGMFCLARRTCSLYSILIISAGSWGRLVAMDGNGKIVFNQPSTFTGSFVQNGCMWNGLYIHAMCGPGADALITINWVEKDSEIV